jgi:peptide chain release factor subunit 3
LHKIDKKTGKKSKHPPKFLKQGDACIARLECNESICLETYDDHQQLGRFTLRDEGRVHAFVIHVIGVTVAIGKVTKLILN